MKKLTMMVFALSVSLSAACVSPPEGEPWELTECASDDCSKNQNKDRPQLTATFVSGHLGNYRDCPGDGYKSEPSDGAAGDADVAAGACAEGQDCSWSGNCEDAQVTIKLANTGDANAYGLQVSRIELFDANGVSRAVLPLMDTVTTSNNESFDGSLAVDEELNLRVEFQGPEDPYTLLDTSDTSGAPATEGDRAIGGYGTIEVTFTADNHDDIVVETGDLYPVPSVDT